MNPIPMPPVWAILSTVFAFLTAFFAIAQGIRFNAQNNNLPSYSSLGLFGSLAVISWSLIGITGVPHTYIALLVTNAITAIIWWVYIGNQPEYKRHLWFILLGICHVAFAGTIVVLIFTS